MFAVLEAPVRRKDGIMNKRQKRLATSVSALFGELYA